MTSIAEIAKKKIIMVLCAMLAVAFVGLFFFYLFYLNHLDINEVGVVYDSWDGKVWLQTEPGWYVTSFFVKVEPLSTLPRVIKIPSNANLIVSKVVQLDIDGIPELINMQGFSYSLNSELDNIFLGYAFSGQRFPFLRIVQEAEPESDFQSRLRRYN